MTYHQGVVTREAPATVGQRLLWMMDHYRGTAEFGAFNCPVLVRIRGRLDRPALSASLDALVRRHEALRTVIRGRGRDLWQQIRDAQPVPVDWRDVSGEPDPRAVADAEITTELRTGIDVGASPIRVRAWILSPVDTLVCVNLHHIVTDAWSTGILFEELTALYARGGDPAGLAPVRWQYADYAQRQHEQQRTGELDRQYAYWLRQLDGAELARPPRRSDAGSATGAVTGVAGVDISARTTRRLRELARTTGATLFTLLLAAYFAQLHRCGRQTDLAVASLFANRSRSESHGTVGFLANMVMLRLHAAGDDPAALLRATHETVVGAFAHQEQPFQTLPPNLVRTGGMRPDDVVFQMVTDVPHTRHGGGAEFELLVPEAIGSRFSFELAVAPLRGGLRVLLFHRRDWFAAGDAEEFVGGYGTLVRRLAATAG